MAAIPALDNLLVRPSLAPDQPADGVPGLFVRQVRRAPAAIAIESDRESLTYAHLNARVNQLAHHLMAKGIRAPSTVAVLLGEPVPVVIALLAVLKAGGTYVSLDARDTADRIHRSMRDAEVAMILTDRAMARKVRAVGIPTILLDVDPAPAKRPGRDPEVPIDQDQLAVVTGARGADGAPTPASYTHRELLRHAAEQRSWAGTGRPGARHASLAGEPAVTMCVPLLLGGTLVLAAERGNSAEL